MIKPYYENDGIFIYQGNTLEVLKEMSSEGVSMVCTSPPYWGLRDYGLEPQIWDEDWRDHCEHEWGEETIIKWGYGKNTYKKWDTGGKKDFGEPEKSQGQSCQLCGAWRGSYRR